MSFTLTGQYALHFKGCFNEHVSVVMRNSNPQFYIAPHLSQKNTDSKGKKHE